MKPKVLLIMTTLILILFSSCKKESEEIKTLSATPSSMIFSKNAGSFALSIESNVNWIVKSNEDWCVPLTTSGSNNGNVNINIEANTTPIQRTAVISIDGDGVSSVTVSVIQDAREESIENIYVTDYDGNIYQAVHIGNQIWMTENLKVTHYPNGDTIPYVTDRTIWTDLVDNNTDDAYCYNTQDVNRVYGALYTWAAAMGGNGESSNTNPSGVQGVCPDGWHLPSDAEWTELINYTGGIGAGSRLKEKGTVHWLSPNYGADNSSGFTALPGGYRDGTNGLNNSLSLYGYWWSATEENDVFAWKRSMSYNSSWVSRDKYLKSYGFSVRCLKD